MRIKSKISTFFAYLFSYNLDYLSSTVFLPALPFLVDLFGVSADKAELLYSFLLMGILVSQIITGTLAIRFSTKKMLILLYPIYIFGALFSGWGESYFQVAIGNFCIGFGIGGIYSLTIALLAQKSDQVAKKVALINIICFFVPYVSVLVGGFLVHLFSWRAPFFLLAILALIFYPINFFLPDEEKKESEGLYSLWLAYKKIISNFHYIKCLISISLSCGIYYVFYTVSPFLFMKELGMTALEYGYIMFIPIIGCVLGSWLCHKVSHLSEVKMIFYANIIIMISAFLFVFFAYEMVNPWLIISCFTLFQFGLSFNYPFLLSHGIKIFITFAATASSLLSVGINSVSSIASATVAEADDKKMSWIILVLALLNFFLFYLFDFLGRKYKH